MQGLLRVFYVITHMFSITLEVFLRYRFGERYLHSLHVILSLGLATLTLIYGPDLISFLPKWGFDSNYILLLAALFVALSIWHLIVIQTRIRRGEEWHSKFSGDSWFYFGFYPIKQKTFQLLVEPALCFFIGYILRGVHDFLAYWIMFASVFMLIKELIEYWGEREPILDQRDWEFESGRRSSASQNVVALASFGPVEGMIGLKEYYKALPSVLQNIIQQVPEVKYERISVKHNDASQQDPFDQKRLYDRVFGDRVYILLAKMVFWLPLVHRGGNHSIYGARLKIFR